MIRLFAIITLGVSLVLAPAHAQAPLPSAPITVHVGFAAGGSADILARLVVEKFRQRTGHAVVVQNRPGAGGTIAAGAVAKMEPDGLNLLLVTSGHAGAQALFPNLRFDTLKDFSPVIALAQSPVVVLVKGTAPYRSIADLVAAMKDKPGRLNYGTGGGGSTLTSLAAMLLKREIGFDAVMVPFTGSGPANLALLGGNIDFQFDIVSSAVGLLSDGSVRALAVTTAQRSRAIPDVPTIGETVRPGFDVAGWFGILAPANVDPALVARFNAEFNAVLADPAIREKLAMLGIDPIGGTPQDFARFLESETKRWGGLIRDLQLKAE